MIYQEARYKKKDYKYCKEVIGNLEKNFMENSIEFFEFL